MAWYKEIAQLSSNTFLQLKKHPPGKSNATNGHCPTHAVQKVTIHGHNRPPPSMRKTLRGACQRFSDRSGTAEAKGTCRAVNGDRCQLNDSKPGLIHGTQICA